VRDLQSTGERFQKLCRLARRQDTIGTEKGMKTTAGKILQGEERHSVRLADLENLNDVRMQHPCRGSGFLEKALPFRGALFGREIGARQDHLQRHQPIESGLPCQEDDAHAAASEFAEDFITRDGETGGRWFLGRCHEIRRPMRIERARRFQGARERLGVPRFWEHDTNLRWGRIGFGRRHHTATR
jgi:hypothetical protein